MPKAPRNPSYFVPALEKGLDVLECLAERGTPQSLTELANALDRTSGEIFRMLSCLEQRGYIVKDAASGTYCLSLKLYELAHTHSPVDSLIRASSLPMRRLAESTGESCHLGVLSHGQLVVLSQAEGSRRVRLSVEVGGKFPPLRTVSGRLLLAYLSTEDRTALLADDGDYRKLKKTEIAKLEANLAEIRSAGCSLAENESHVGIRDVAVPVGNPNIGVTASLAVCSLATPGKKDWPDPLLQALRRCAKEITESVGLTS